MAALNISKKISYLVQLKTLYSYIFHRALVKVRNTARLAPLYPYEDVYKFDQETERILEDLKKTIPDHLRGDNPAFNKNWKDVFEREETAKKIGAKIQAVTGPAGFSVDPSNPAALRNQGYLRLQSKNLSVEKVDEIVRFLDAQKVYPSHVAHFSLQKPQSKEEVKKSQPFGSYDVETILKTPYIAGLLSDPEVVGTIADYFGCLPTVSSVNLFWSFASPDGKPRGPQNFHRDIDDYKTCTMFINLTDTKEDEGAHCYVEKTHTHDRLKEVFVDAKNDSLPSDLNPWNRRIAPEDLFALPLNGYSFEKLYTHFFKDRMVPLYGQRGSVLITDNYGIHRGVPSKQKDRLILWISFALTATHTISAEVKLQKRVPYAELKNHVQDNKINRYVLRNVIDFSKK
jgi:hypothetical protein